MLPTIGRIVHYTLSEQDAKLINERRKADAEKTGRPSWEYGNEARAGDTYPAMIVRTFGGTTVNLQVFLDGPDAYWATSRQESASGEPDHFCWIWPPRA